ncbi:MAG: hypothetical protein LBT54_03515 [Bifidobacteriaceae bacterium]|nr:hypothetical protein [Bifidobacteriaceae bacterium]
MSDGIVITGGAAGVKASQEDLARIVARLAEAVEALDDCHMHLRAAADDAVGAPAGECAPPATVRSAKLRVLQRITSVRDSVWGPGACAARVGELKANVGAAARAYEEAEREAVRGMTFLDGVNLVTMNVQNAVGWGKLATLPVLLAWWAQNALAAALRGDYYYFSEAVRDLHPGIRELLAGWLGIDGLGTRSSEDVAGFVAAIGFALNPAGFAIRRSGAYPGEGPRDVPGLIDQVLAASRAGAAGNPQIRLTRIIGPDGRPSWAVAISGTIEPGDLFGSGDCLEDSRTNLAGVAGMNTEVAQAVMAALKAAGAKPGESVLLAGHSQGGIVAAGLAASSQFNQRYKVAGVLTAGSPVSTIKVPESVPLLAVEHRQDFIPALAGGRNSDGRNHVTVVRDLAKSDNPAERDAGKVSAGDLAKLAPPKADLGGLGAELMAPHSLDLYKDTVVQVLESGDPSVAAWQQAATSMLAPGAVMTTYVYSIRRPQPEPDPEPAPSPTPRRPPTPAKSPS